MTARPTPALLLEIRDLRIEGRTPATAWQRDRQGHRPRRSQRGEVLGLIGESGAGKSTIGLAAMGYRARRLPHRRRHRSSSTAWTWRALPRARTAQAAGACASPMCAQIGGRRLQPGAPPDRADLRGRRCGTASCAAAEARARRRCELFRRLRLPNPETHRPALSAPGLRRAAAAGDDRDGDVLPARPHRLRRADHGARRHHADRGAGGDPRRWCAQSGTAAIYITHDLAVVAQMADRIMVLRHGKLVEEAATRSMLSTPREAYTRALWAVRALHKAGASLAATRAARRCATSTAGYGNGLHGAARRVASTCRAAARSRWSASPARASRRWRA